MRLQPITAVLSSKFYYLILMPLAMLSVVAILGFKSNDLALSSFPVFTKDDSGIQINENQLRKSNVQVAIITKTEQMENVFSKVLHLSVEDKKGNLVALMLTDFQNSRRSICMSESIFFGGEHEQSDLNFSRDVGSTVFLNQCNLIIEKNDGTSTISRNGWIKINKCENGSISGSFEFSVDEINKTSISKGTFENISFEVEG